MIEANQDIIGSGDVADDIMEMEDVLETSDDSDEQEEAHNRLEVLRDFEQDGFSEFGSEWYSGITLVHESHWEDYARELAEDTCMVDRDSALYGYVNWEAWADDLKTDYTEIQLEGEVYWGRS